MSPEGAAAHRWSGESTVHTAPSQHALCPAHGHPCAQAPPCGQHGRDVSPLWPAWSINSHCRASPGLCLIPHWFSRCKRTTFSAFLNTVFCSIKCVYWSYVLLAYFFFSHGEVTDNVSDQIFRPPSLSMAVIKQHFLSWPYKTWGKEIFFFFSVLLLLKHNRSHDPLFQLGLSTHMGPLCQCTGEACDPI